MQIARCIYIFYFLFTEEQTSWGLRVLRFRGEYFKREKINLDFSTALLAIRRRHVLKFVHEIKATNITVASNLMDFFCSYASDNGVSFDSLITPVDNLVNTKNRKRNDIFPLYLRRKNAEISLDFNYYEWIFFCLIANVMCLLCITEIFLIFAGAFALKLCIELIDKSQMSGKYCLQYNSHRKVIGNVISWSRSVTSGSNKIGRILRDN